MSGGRDPAGATERGRPWWVLLCLGAVAVAAWTLAAFHRGPFTGLVISDAAVPPLLAGEILRTGAWVPSSWYYVNDDIWLLAPQLFCLPFVWAWGPSSRSLAAGNLLGLAVSGVCVYLLARRITGSRAAALVIALGLLAPFSVLQRELVHVQLAYGWIFAYLCLLLFLALRIVERPGHSFRALLPRPAVWAYAFLVLLLVGGNLARGLVYWLFPVLVVSGVEGRSPPARAPFLGLAGVTVGAALVGLGLHFWLRSRFSLPGWEQLFRTRAGWGRKLGFAWQGLPSLIGLPAAGSWPSGDGALAVLRCAFLGAALFALVVVWRPRTALPPAVRVGARFGSLLLGSVLGSFVLSKLVTSAATVRYFIPPVLLGLLILLALGARWLGPRSPAFLGVVAVFGAAFLGGGALAVAGEASVPRSPCAGEARLCPLLALAEESGLSAGFASYWNANASTLASGGAIRVCGVSLEPLLKPGRWLTSSDCFREEHYRGGFFVALQPDEREPPVTEVLLASLGPPSRRAPAGEFEVWIYDPSPTRDWAWLGR